MHKLLQYHGPMSGSAYFWLHVEVGLKLLKGEITTFKEYTYECSSRGITNYNEELFNSYIESRPIKDNTT